MRSLAKLLLSLWLFVVTMSAAAVDGIWMGEIAGRNGEKQDLAFQFVTSNGVLTGVMFGDEFDLPVQELKIDGNRVSFTVTTINFYDGRRLKFTFAGTIGDKSLELTREQSNVGGAPVDPAKQKDSAQTIVLKRLSS